jgi:hypothetical protein
MAAVLSGALVIATAPVQGAYRGCRQLEAELAASSRGNVKATSAKAYDRAIRRQSEQISATRNRVREAGCGFSLFSGNVRQCAMLNAALQRMSSNLDSLQRKRETIVHNAERRSPSHILALLEARGCREKVKPSQRIPEEAEAPLAEQPGVTGAMAPDLENDGGHIIVRPSAYGSGSGEFRTLCVRTCDGYFFPMSNAAALGDFQRDQANCESACPGTEMQLFYQRGMSDDTSAMLSSVTGKPYSELPSAYFYKRPDAEKSVACGCNAARNFAIIGGAPSSGHEAVSNGASPSFAPLPAPATNGPGAEAAQPFNTSPARPQSRPGGKRQVRVVGPRFLPDPAGAIDLQAPARTQGR